MNHEPSQLVTVATLQSATEANLAKNQLEAAGIHAYLSGEEAAMAWHMAGALGGIKLQVVDDDVEDALNLLEQKPWEESSAVDRTALVTSETLQIMKEDGDPDKVLSD